MKKNRKKHVVIMVMISLICLLFTTGCSAKGLGNKCGKCSQDAFVFGCVGCAKCIQCSGCTEGFMSGCTDLN